jgi:hypothetical protein
MGLDLMQVFNDYVMPATIETLDQMVDKFNEASGGAIRLTTAGYDGDFFHESFYAGLHSARRRVDRYGSNSAVATTDLSQNKETRVKIAGGFGPVLFEPSQLTWLEKSPAEAIEVISRNFAEALLADQLNTGIMAAVAAIENNTDAVYDASTAVSPPGGINYKTINKSHAKFGDHSGTIVAEVMTGGLMHKLIGQNLSNAERLFVAQNVRVIDILGRIVVVTDAPALYEDNSPGNDMEKVLGLTDSGVVISDGGDVITNIDTKNGKERIETTFQADYSFTLGLKGYAWDTTSGGKSPTDAELATGSNWDQVATSVKHTAGVLAIGDATVDE